MRVVPRPARAWCLAVLPDADCCEPAAICQPSPAFFWQADRGHVLKMRFGSGS